jgi:hypothetical protein
VFRNLESVFRSPNPATDLGEARGAHEGMGMLMDFAPTGHAKISVGAFLVDLRLRPDQKELSILQRA